MEAVLRRSQCAAALHALRLRLHTKRHFVMFRNVYMRGQCKTGCVRTLINSISDSVDAQAMKYHNARQALVQLDGEESCGEFKALNKEDIRLCYIQDHDAQASQRLARLAGRPTQSMMQGINMCHDTDDEADTGAEERRVSRSTLAWIWTAQGAPDNLDEYLHDSVRVEWLKSFARKERWREEVALGEEKMTQTLLLLKYEVGVWRERAQQEFGSICARLGRQAYTWRQAAMYEALHVSFTCCWSPEDAYQRKRPRRTGGDLMENDGEDEDTMV